MGAQPDLDSVCKLARLHIPEKDRKELRSRMVKVIAWFDKLKECEPDDDAKEPVSSSVLTLHLRDDVPEASLTQQEALSQAPEKSDGYFQVPKVIKQK